MGEPMMVFIGI